MELATGVRGVVWLCALAVVAALSADPQVSQAQSPTDITSSGLGTLISPRLPGGVYQITGGTPKDANLFHSFGRFTIDTGDKAQFVNQTGSATKNIVGRITDGRVSSIFGTIDTLSYPGANLFLINPAGVIFGSTAKLEVGGSFHASTADFIRFADGSQFFANPSKPNGLTTFPPTAFGFLPSNAGTITIAGATLTVPEGRTLALVGTINPLAGRTVAVTAGDIAITGSTLSAPSGQIQLLAGTGASAGGLSTPDTKLEAPNGLVHLGGVTSSGEVTVRSASNVTGRIDLSNGATIDVSGSGRAPNGNPGGSVVIRGGSLFATDGAFIDAETLGSKPGAATGIDLQVTGDVVLSNASGFQVRTAGAGKAGDVRITAGTLQMDTAAFVDSITAGTGRGGDVVVNAGRVTLTGGADFSSQSTTTQSGPGGSISISTTAIDIAGPNSEILSFTKATSPNGVGGPITIVAPSVTLTDGAKVVTTASGGASGGAITVQATNLSLTGGALITSQENNPSTLPHPPSGGNITVTATELATMSGRGTAISSTGPKTGNASAGEIEVDVGKLVLTDSAMIGNPDPRQNGGNIAVTATDSIVMARGGSILSQAFLLPVGRVAVSAPRLTMDDSLIQASTINQGKAGDITVTVTGDLTLTGGAQIATSSAEAATGAGGNLTIHAGSVFISGSAPHGQPVSTFSNDPSSGLFSTAAVQSKNAGNVTVFTPTLTLADGGKISADTAATTGVGRGGNIEIHASRVRLANGGRISATSSGTVDAGNVTIAGDLVTLRNSAVTTDATQGEGGNVAITATSLVDLYKSQITTSVKGGKGGGGNITIDPQFVVLDNSQVRADAFGGPGGNIDIVANVFLTSRSLLSASSALSAPGTINIQASTTNVSGTLARLPESLLQAATLLRASCAARVAAGKASSLVVGGRGGLPLEPGDLVPSPLLAEGSADTGLARNEGNVMETLPRLPRSVLVPMCSR